jgi:lipid-A-disaccharide synthase
MIKIKYASLINIIANREIIPEFLQYDCTPKAISESLISLLSNTYLRNEQIEKNKEVLSMLDNLKEEKETEENTIWKGLDKFRNN